jgi:hypothetical protein
MDAHYLIGVALAILSGVLNQYGQLLQKKAVNEIPPEVREQRFMRTLIRHPAWITGMVLAIGFGSVAFMFAQGMIGPALVPGLMASGLIVLAIGSVKMNKETLDKTEGLGIVIMIVGIILLGMSELGINSEQVRVALADRATWLRITVFTLSLLFLWGVLHLLAFRSVKRKGIILALELLDQPARSRDHHRPGRQRHHRTDYHLRTGVYLDCRHEHPRNLADPGGLQVRPGEQHHSRPAGARPDHTDHRLFLRLLA